MCGESRTSTSDLLDSRSLSFLCDAFGYLYVHIARYVFHKGDVISDCITNAPRRHKRMMGLPAHVQWDDAATPTLSKARPGGGGAGAGVGAQLSPTPLMFVASTQGVLAAATAHYSATAALGHIDELGITIYRRTLASSLVHIY